MAFRRTDPEASRKAFLQLVSDGKIGERQLQVLSLVERYPGLTHGELAARMYAAHRWLGILCCAETPHKRLPELERKGLVRSGDSRKCGETGKEARTWFMNIH